MMKSRNILMVAVALVALSACAKKRVELPPAPIGTQGSGTSTTPTQPSGPTPGSQEDFVASVSADRIFFDTDRFDVDAEDQEVLRSQATWLAKYPSKRVTIEGHCDEIGRASCRERVLMPV